MGSFARARDLAIGFVARAWIATLRLEVIESSTLASHEGRPRAYAFWHGQQFALLRWARGRKLTALVSRSNDGGMVAAALAKLGVMVTRGSSSRGGAAALRGIIRLLRAGVEAAFAVDGPKGPRGIVRTDGQRVGASVAAALANGIVVPLASASRAKIVARRAWDLFELPLPGSRVAVVLGAPLEPGEATPDRLAAAIDEARATAEAALGPVAAARLEPTRAAPLR